MSVERPAASVLFLRTVRARTTGIVVLASLCYLPSLGNGFHYDDFHSIVRNPNLRSFANLPAFFTDPTRFSVNPESAMYRPVLLSSYALNFAFGDLRPNGYHFVSVVLHGLNAGLVYRLLLLLGIAPSIGLAAAAAFALNPVHSEAVNYVSSRSELLAATGVLSACGAHLRFLLTGSKLWYAFALGFTALALGTKEVAVSLLVLLPLCHAYRHDLRAALRRWRCYAGYVLLAAAYVAVAHQVVDRALLEPVRGYEVHLYTQLKALPYYALLAILPVQLSPEHQFALAPGLDSTVLLATALVITAALVLFRWRSVAIPRLAAVWVAAVLAPSTVVPLIVLVNEHRLYLSGAAFGLVSAIALIDLMRRRGSVAVCVVGLYTIVFGVLVVQRTIVWSDELTLWRDAAAKAPAMVKPHLQVGDILQRAGMAAAAEEAYKKAVMLRTEHVAARNNLGSLYMRDGRLRLAEEQFRTLLVASPDNLPGRLNLAGTLMRSGRWQEAREHYEKTLEYGDTQGRAQEYLADIALRFDKQPEVAIAYLNQAVSLSKDVRAGLLVNRGVALRRLGRLVDAEADYRTALQADSTYADAWFNLGNLMVYVGRRTEAGQAFEKVIALNEDPTLTTRAREQIRILETRRQ